MNAIFNSQENCVSYRGVFHEPLACNYAKWASGYARHELLPRSTKVCFNKWSYLNQRVLSVNTLFFSTKLFLSNSLSTIVRKEQFQCLSKTEWSRFFRDEEKVISSMSSLDNFYQRLAEIHSKENLFIRWNQGFSYIPLWLRNSNHYWISVVRNPIARAKSYLKSHDSSYADSLYDSVGFANVTDRLLHNPPPNWDIIYFEDLIEKGESSLLPILRKFKLNLNNINLDKLYASDGQPFRNETSSLVDEGKDRIKGVEYQGLDKAKLYGLNLDCPDGTIESYRAELKNFDTYRRYYESNKSHQI